MGLLNAIIEIINQSLAAKILTAVFFVLVYPVVQAIYNLYFHPLSHLPGPKLWAASRLPFIYCLITGKLVKREREFHEKYGEVLRLAPDEVSFASEQAWNDIYTFRPRHKRALRDKAYYIAPNNQVDNVVTTNDAKFHLRVRTLLSNSFTEDSLRKQHPLIHHHADLLVAQLRKLASSPENLAKGARVNMTDWFNFFTVDVIGDLAFGQSFGCLERGDYHDWVLTLFNYLKGMVLAAAPRYHPMAEFLFQKLIPKKVIEGQKRHTQYANDMINRRLDSKTDRPDFIGSFMRKNLNFEVMSRDEILSTFNFIIVGGSETIATTLTGIFNNLVKHERILKRLCREIRSKFQEESEISIDAIQDLPYLEAVLNEGLRMCNPIPGGLPRVAPEGGDTYAGVFVPGGMRCSVRTFVVNRSAKLFANPDSFVPERWLPKGERPTEYDNDHLNASKPFSLGFHSCLGRPLAWVELRLVLVRLLWAFDFVEEARDAVDFEAFPVTIIIEKLPMVLRVKIRSDVIYKPLAEDLKV